MGDPDQVIPQNHERGFRFQMVFVPLGACVIGIATLVTGVLLHHVAPLVTGAGLTVFGVLWLSIGLGASRPTILTSTALRQRKLFSYRAIDLKTITGVALLWGHGQGVGGAWRVYVWVHGQGTRAVEPARLWEGSHDPASDKPKRYLGRGFIPPLDWDTIACSEPAKAAVAIYKRAVAAQGATGGLARQNVHDSGEWPPGLTVVAWWSPDGGVGAVDHAA
jgi:hypothetical protein